MWTRKSSLLVGVGFAVTALGLASSSLGVLALGLVALAFVLVNRFFFRGSAEIVAERRLDLHRVFEGDSLRIDIDITNPGSRLLFLEVRDRLPRQLKVEEGAPYDFVALPRGGTASLHYTVGAPLLGVYAVGPTDLRLEDPFGLFFEERAVEGDSTLWVLPRKEDLRKAALLSRLPLPLLGEHQVNRPGDGFDFFALREYVPGDTMRQVNWKASARSGKMMVNQMERTTAAEIAIFVDGRAIIEVGPEDSSPRLGIARATATIVDFAYVKKDNARVIIYNDHVREIEPMPAERMIPYILETMAELSPRGDVPLRIAVSDVLPSLKPSTPVVIISSLLDDATISEAVSILLANDMVVTVITPEPVSLPGVDIGFANALLAERLSNIQTLQGFGAFVVNVAPDESLATTLEKGAILA